MADFSQIIQEINDNVNTNGTGAITGAKLNEVLRDMIDSVDDKNVSKLVVSDISQLNQEQIESLRVGDSVVEQKNGKNVAYLVAQKENNVTKLIRTELSTIFSVQYNLYTFGGIGMCFLAERAPYSTAGHLAILNSNGNPTDSGKKVSDFATSSQGAKADTAYQKPSSGIPESDLSSDVQQALQKHFKGWYASSSALPSNPVVGDYAYVKGASSTDPAAIYECTTAGSWSDSGRTADTSNVQTFASGQEVNEVHIINDLTTGGTEDVLSAEQGKEIGNVLYSEITFNAYLPWKNINNVWKKTTYRSSRYYQAKEGDVFVITANATRNNKYFFATTIDNIVENEPIPYLPGYAQVYQITANTTQTFEAPSDCYVIVVNESDAGANALYQDAKIYVNAIKTKLNSQVFDNVLEYNEQSISPTFVARGYYINNVGNWVSNNNWTTSEIIHVLPGAVITMTAKSTGDINIGVAKTDYNGSYYTPLMYINGTMNSYQYVVDEACYIRIQYYRKEGNITIEGDSLRILNIEAAIKPYIPDYLIAERDRVYRRITPMLNDEVALIGFTTDQHITLNDNNEFSLSNPNKVVRSIKNLAYLASLCPIDIVVFGGDVAGYSRQINMTIDGIIQETNLLYGESSDIQSNIIALPGNHDAYQNNGNITASAMYNTCYKRTKTKASITHEGKANCDCYFDDPDKKIRYIFVDTYTTNVRDDSYTTFLTNSLSSMPQDYNAIIFSHNPLTNEFEGVLFKYTNDTDENPSPAFEGYTDLHTIIDVYADRIIACVCGHTHTDAWGISNSGVLYITTTSATHTRRRFESIPYKSSLNNAKEAVFDIFVINTNTNEIEAVRYGQGTNRKWKYKGTGQGLLYYKNCVSGICSIPSLTLMFTNTENNTDIISVVCDSEGKFETYLSLGSTYNIACDGYTLDVDSVEVDGDKELNITMTT